MSEFKNGSKIITNIDCYPLGDDVFEMYTKYHYGAIPMDKAKELFGENIYSMPSKLRWTVHDDKLTTVVGNEVVTLNKLSHSEREAGIIKVLSPKNMQALLVGSECFDWVNHFAKEIKDGVIKMEDGGEFVLRFVKIK